MCHQTLRGKEWCTNNQETGGQTVRLIGLLFGVFNNWTVLFALCLVVVFLSVRTYVSHPIVGWDFLILRDYYENRCWSNAFIHF
ncbi:hypothetical protein [Paenibacillus sp. DCT19]|uniref:hypothetical protein n=1 Tax=Paenibacillus sp. DCT19 TaxID=2211212 RepID=UPI000FE23BF1|nr:hypothetical protein [Paenibacillus sp. DCT19]